MSININEGENRSRVRISMNNNIWGKSLYNHVINSYMKTPSSPKIKGTLLEVNENKIKLGIGNEKALNITLNKPLNAAVGETVVIHKKDILKSQLINQVDAMAAESIQNKYDYILDSLGIQKKEESINAVKTLDSYGVDITKENILSFMAAKEQLNSITEKLDYDTAVKLKDKEIDFEKESLQKVLQEMQNVQGEKRPFSLLRFLGLKKDLSTEEAEKIAYNIYGSKMGKDITDIIKALHKAGIEPTKEKIEEVNRVFAKLNNIENIEDKTIIDSIKNKIETTIDNLYKLKNAVVKGAIGTEEKLGKLASRVYGAYSAAVSSVTEADLKQIEGDIKARLEALGVKVTEELVHLSKEVISKGLDLTKENLEKIMAVKGAIAELNGNLDYEKTALLMASGVEVDKTDVVELVNMIDVSTAGAEESIHLGLNRLEILELIEHMDMKTLALHMKFNLPSTLESLGVSQKLLDGDLTVGEWLGSLNRLGIEEGMLPPDADIAATIERLTGTENSEVDMAAKTYLRLNSDKLGPIMDESYRGELAKALIQNGIALNHSNMQELYMLKKSLDRVSDHLSSNMLQKAAEEGRILEKLHLNKLADLVASLDEGTEGKGKVVENLLRDGSGTMAIVDQMKGMVDTLKQISSERRNSIISLLMKNAMPLTLKEVQKLSFFLDNQRQIGHQLDEILELVNRNNNAEILDLAEKLRNRMNEINSYIKEGRPIGEKPYEEFSKILRELENKAIFLSSGDRSSLQKSGEKLLDSLELQLHLNREDTVLQLPLMMGDQFKNLQMYVMRDKKGSKKIDPKNMSVLLNFDTNNMGNVNIYLGVNYKNIVMKIGLGNKEDQSLIEAYSKDLEKYLEGRLGYDLKDLSFRIHEDNHILSMVEETEGNHRSMKKLLDVRV